MWDLFCHDDIVAQAVAGTLFPQSRPFRVDAFVQRHTYRVHLVNRSVKVRFQITVCS